MIAAVALPGRADSAKSWTFSVAPVQPFQRRVAGALHLPPGIGPFGIGI